MTQIKPKMINEYADEMARQYQECKELFEQIDMCRSELRQMKGLDKQIRMLERICEDMYPETERQRKLSETLTIIAELYTESDNRAIQRAEGSTQVRDYGNKVSAISVPVYNSGIQF